MRWTGTKNRVSGRSMDRLTARGNMSCDRIKMVGHALRSNRFIAKVPLSPTETRWDSRDWIARSKA